MICYDLFGWRRRYPCLQRQTPLDLWFFRRWFWTLHGDKGLNRCGEKRAHWLTKKSMVDLGHTCGCWDVNDWSVWWEDINTKGYEYCTMRLWYFTRAILNYFAIWALTACIIPINRSFDINFWLPSKISVCVLTLTPYPLQLSPCASQTCPCRWFNLPCEANLVASSVGDTMARDWGYWTGHFTGRDGSDFLVEAHLGWRDFWRFQGLAGFEIKKSCEWKVGESGMIMRDHVSLELE